MRSAADNRTWLDSRQVVPVRQRAPQRFERGQAPASRQKRREPYMENRMQLEGNQPQLRAPSLFALLHCC